MKCGHNINYRHIGSSFLRFVVIETITLLISIGLILIIGICAASVSGHIYDGNQPIQNPILRGEDFGGGLVMVLSAIGSLFVSLPIAIMIHFYAFKKYYLTRSGNCE